MLFCILRGNSLVARYVEKGSMVSLVAVPIKRRAIVLTQMTVLISGILLLIRTVLELICAGSGFPGELDTIELLVLNGGLCVCSYLLEAYVLFLLAYFLIRNTVFHSEQGFQYLCMYCRCLQMLAEMQKKQSILHFLLCLIIENCERAKHECNV